MSFILFCVCARCSFGINIHHVMFASCIYSFPLFIKINVEQTSAPYVSTSSTIYGHFRTKKMYDKTFDTFDTVPAVSREQELFGECPRATLRSRTCQKVYRGRCCWARRAFNVAFSPQKAEFAFVYVRATVCSMASARFPTVFGSVGEWTTSDGGPRFTTL